MCDGTPCMCYGGTDPDEHRARHPAGEQRWHPEHAPPRSPRAEQLAVASWWPRIRAMWRCWSELGHCLHLHRDASPMEPEWYCCECPRDRVGGIPDTDCAVCNAPGAGYGVAP